MPEHVYATGEEVRTYLGARLPTLDDTALDALVLRATDAIDTDATRYVITDDTGRAVDEEIRRHLIVAVSETVLELHRVDAAEAVAGSTGVDLTSVLEAGGSIKAGTLTVTGGSGGSAGQGGNSGGTTVLPTAAVAALRRAGLIGGGVAAW